MWGRGSLIASGILAMILALPAALFGSDAYFTTLWIMLIPAVVIVLVSGKAG